MNHYPLPEPQFVSTCDLRVVAGLHAGARIAIGDAANGVLTVGHGPECDVVLQDPALADGHLTIRLVRSGEGIVEGWQVGRDDMPGDIVALGEVVRWGGLGLTVAEQDAAWPSIDIMHEATLAGDAALASEIADAGEASLTPQTTGTQHPDGTTSDDADQGPDAQSGAAGEHANGDLDANGEATVTGDALPDDNAYADMPTDASDAGATAHDDAIAGSTPPEKRMRLASRLSARLRGRFSTIPAAIILAIVSVVVVFLLGMLLIRILNGAGVRNTPVKVMPATANQSAAQVTKVIARLGLSSVLHLTTTRDGVVAVVGWVRDEAQRDQVASALAQLTPMPGMMVSIESEAVGTVQQIVKQYGTYIDVINQGGGQIRLIGLIEPADARAQLETVFHSQLPTAVLLDDRLLGREQMAAKLESALIDAGMPTLGVVWTNTGMQIEAKHHGRRPERISGDKVYAVVQAFKQQYGMRLPIFANLNGEQEALLPRALPFNISSITGGPLPSVVVDDGLSVSGGQTRLLPGGVYRGYKLISITPQQVVFDGPQRVVVTR